MVWWTHLKRGINNIDDPSRRKLRVYRKFLEGTGNFDRIKRLGQQKKLNWLQLTKDFAERNGRTQARNGARV